MASTPNPSQGHSRFVKVLPWLLDRLISPALGLPAAGLVGGVLLVWAPWGHEAATSRERVGQIDQAELALHKGVPLIAGYLSLRADGTRSWFSVFLEPKLSRVAVWDVEGNDVVKKLELTVTAPSAPSPPRSSFSEGSGTKLRIPPFSIAGWRLLHAEMVGVRSQFATVDLLNGGQALVLQVEASNRANPVLTYRVAPLVIAWNGGTGRYSAFGISQSLPDVAPVHVRLNGPEAKTVTLFGGSSVAVARSSRLTLVTTSNRRATTVIAYRISPSHVVKCGVATALSFSGDRVKRSVVVARLRARARLGCNG